MCVRDACEHVHADMRTLHINTFKCLGIVHEGISSLRLFTVYIDLLYHLYSDDEFHIITALKQ